MSYFNMNSASQNSSNVGSGSSASSSSVTVPKSDGLTVTQPVAPGSTAPSKTEGSVSTLDDSTPKVTSIQGVHLSEQQQTVVIRSTDGNQKLMNDRANAHLNEPDWDLKKMLARENLVGAFQWAISDTVGSEISITGSMGSPTDVPTDLLQNDIVSAPFTRFTWWNMKMARVRFQLVGSRFHQGQLGVYWVPTMLPKANVTLPGFHPTRFTQLTHGFLDPSNGTVLDLEIPFQYNKGWVDLVAGDVLGQIRVQVMNQLQAASGASTSVEVKVFVTFEDSHFRVPRSGGSSFKAQLEKEAAMLGYSLVRHATKQSGMFQTLGSDIGGDIDKLVESVIPAEVTGAIAGVALDKPAVTEYPPPLTRKDAQYMSASRGVENLERMTLEPSAQYITDNQFGAGVDETDMKYLLKKRVYIGTFNWAATAPVGTILYQTLVSPSHLNGETSPGSPFNPTIIGFLANLFTYWRGSISFYFQVRGTSFHEGRLDFCNHPGITTVPSDYRASMSQYVNSQTIRNTNNTVEVRIPYHSDIPWRRVWNGETLSDVVTDSAVRSLDYVTGCFSVRVAVPLKAPNNVANNVDVNVFISGGEDFEFHTLSPWGGRYVVSGLEFAQRRRLRQLEERQRYVNLRKAVKQSGRVGVSGDLNQDPKSDQGVIPLGVGNVYTYDPKIHHFGETYTNLRECCKRYQTVQSSVMTLAVGDNIKSFKFAGSDMGGLLGALFNSYRLFRGPMAFKIQLHAKAVAGANNYGTTVTGFCTTNVQPALFASGTPASYALMSQQLGFPNTTGAAKNTMLQPPLVRFSTNQVGEFLVPFQSIYHSLISDQLFDDVPLYYGNCFSQWEIIYNIMQYFGSDTTNQAYVTLAAAFGDETRLGVFLGFPELLAISPVAYPLPNS